MATSSPHRWHGREPVYAGVAPLVRAATRAFARVRVHGLQHVPREGPAIVAANHVSHLDPMVLLTALRETGRRPRFIAVSGLWDVPVVGWLLRKGRMIEVERGRGPQAMVEAAVPALRAGQLLVVYPEGTIVPPGEQRSARPGAGLLALEATEQLQVPTVPTAIRGLDHYEGGLPRLGQHVTVTFGPPVDLTAWRGRRDRDAQLEVSATIMDVVHGLARASLP